MTETPNLLIAAPPSEWASCPAWMTFSLARDTEQCPRRESLRRSEYKGIWQGHGYPPGFSAAGTRGMIVHASLRHIAKELAHEGCETINDPHAFEVLKRMGGYSAVLGAEIQHWISRCDGNPRLQREKLAIQQRLERLLPEMRLSLQNLLRYTHLEADDERAMGLHHVSLGELHHGCYFEVELRHPGLHWKGFADLVELTAAGDITIVDFKTGQPKQTDERQLLLYALLWARDYVRNPKKRLATKLILQYPGESKPVTAPDSAVLAGLEKELEGRSSTIRNALKMIPPVANIRSDTCPFCDVRHLCAAYWSATSEVLHENGVGAYAIDCEIALQNQIAYSTWKAKSLFATAPRFPKTLAVHFSDPTVLEGLQGGDHLRIMQTAIENAESEPPIITVRPTTEMFKVLPNEQNESLACTC